MEYVDYIKALPLKTFRKGEVLLQKGDMSDMLMAIRTGFVKVTSINNAGIERLIWIAGRYDFAPSENIFSKRGTTQFFYTALTDGTYYEVDKADFLDKAQEQPQLMTEIAKGLSNHYDDLLQRIDAIDAPSLTERLLLTILYLVERISAETSVDLVEHGLALTHADFANLIGSTRETTSLLLSNLRSEGCIDYSRSKFIVNTDKIRVLAGV